MHIISEQRKTGLLYFFLLEFTILASVQMLNTSLSRKNPLFFLLEKAREFEIHALRASNFPEVIFFPSFIVLYYS